MCGRPVGRRAFGALLAVALLAWSGCCAGLFPAGRVSSPQGVAAPRTQVSPRPLDEGPGRPDAPAGPVAEPADPGTRRRGPHRFPYVARKLTCAQAMAAARAAAPAGRLEAALVFAVMRVESAFSTNVVSPAGAVGLMQVMPENVARLGCGDLFDGAQNAACGVKVLRRFLDRYDGDLMLALSGYNAGLGMPGRARDEVRVPANLSYVEKVFRFRARVLRRGCKAFD